MADKLKIDDSLIRQLAKLLDETGLSEIEIGEGAQHVRVARGSAGAAVGREPAPAGADGEARSAEIEANHPGAVTSPMVGTLYFALEPGAPPFVVPGASVHEGETMFIIEAMKTMNPVRAPRGGKVVRILAHNETPVEYGEVLALIE